MALYPAEVYFPLQALPPKTTGTSQPGAGNHTGFEISCDSKRSPCPTCRLATLEKQEEEKGRGLGAFRKRKEEGEMIRLLQVLLLVLI